MAKKIKTLIPIHTALTSRVEFHKKRGRKYSPVIPNLLHPKQIEREYTRDLRQGFTKLFRLVSSRLLTALPSLLAKSSKELEPQRFDSAEDDLRLILDSILVEFGRQFPQNVIKQNSEMRGIETSDFNRKQNNKVYRQLLDVDIFVDEPWLQDSLQNFASENTELITTLSEKHIASVRNVVINGMRQGMSLKELEERIRNKVNGKTTANFKLIARDQISKLNGQFSKLRQESVGVKRYVWRTAQDERVRPTHRSKEGEEFMWSKPPSDTGHPGNDFQCRCYGEPVLEDLI